MATRRLPTEQRRAQLSELALRLLAEGGPQALTLAKLGKKAGITDASVLRHFKDKDAIVDAAIAYFGELLDEDFPKDIQDPMCRLGVFFVRRLYKVRERPELMALAYNSRLQDAAGEKGEKHLKVHILRSQKFILDCIVQAQEKGTISGGIPPEMWMWNIMGQMRGGAQKASFLGEDTAQMSAEHVWEIIESMMKTALFSA